MERTPVFIKGHLEFIVDRQTIEHRNKNLSIFGVTGLPWAPLSPARHFGMKIIVNLTIVLPQPVKLVTDAFIMREQTPYGEYMSVRFIMNTRTQRNLEKLITDQGFFPVQNMRKYPRIPRFTNVQTFPLKVIGTAATKTYDIDPTPVVFDVQDLSLGGILLSTENPFALSFAPGQKINLYLEPRGSFSIQITVQGQISRTMEERNPNNDNMVRYFGVRFTKVDESNKVAFLELLRDILERLKAHPELQVAANNNQ